MILTIILVIPLLVGIICHICEVFEYGIFVIMAALFFWGGPGLCYVLTQFEINSQLQEIEAVRQTVETARASGREIENAALQVKIAEQNAWISRVQYQNTTALDPFIPDEVMDVKPIQ